MKLFRPYLPLLVIVLLVVGYMFTGPSRLTLDLMVTILIFATFATAWNIAGGMTGLFSLGHGALFAIGAFGTTLFRLNLGMPTFLAILLSAGIAVIVALFIGMMSLRLRGHYFGLATLGLSVIMFIMLQNFPNLTGGDEGIRIPKDVGFANLIFNTKDEYVFVALTLYAITAIVVIILGRSKRGYQMRAVKEDEVSARSIGIPAVQVKLFAVGLSGFFSALAGSLFAQYTLYITPANVGSVSVSWEPALMAIIGGMVGVFGPLLGAALITLLEHFVVEAVGSSIPGLSGFIYGGLLIVCILVLPNGVMGLLRNGTGWVRRKFTKEPKKAVQIDTVLNQVVRAESDTVSTGSKLKEES